jgi:hypothetical protein
LEENHWIEFKHYSVQACNSTSTYSFTAEVLCDKSITSAGNPKIISVDTSHCEAKVVVAHKAGCPAGKAMNLSNFINEYPWVLGLIMIIGGPIVALFGRRWFPWVTAGIVSMTALLLCLIFCEITGFMEKPIEIVASVIFSLSLALLSGWFVMKTVWVAIGLLGVIGGLFVGEVVYAFFIFELGAHQLWVMVLFCVFCASLGGLLSFYFSKKVVLFATSLIGSYSFMRGWSYFFGGFPNEEDILLSLYENMQLQYEFEERFWYYIAMFIVGTLGGIYYQSLNDHEHELLKGDLNYQKSDDNYKRVKETVTKRKEELKVKFNKQREELKERVKKGKEELSKKVKQRRQSSKGTEQLLKDKAVESVAEQGSHD